MSDVLRPGPYKTGDGAIVVVLDGAPDEDGDVAAHRNTQHFAWSYYELSSLTASDVWPDWWPFQDTPIPERHLQVGDFIRYQGEHTSDTFEVIGLRFGHVQVIGRTGESFSEPMPLDVGYKRVERPSDWPTE